MKKFVSVLLALAMTLALSVSALAAGTNTITVTGAQEGETYNIYKMLDLSVNLEKGAYTYTVNENWTDFFTAPGAGAAYVTITDGYVAWNAEKDNAADKEAFGKAAATYAAEKKITPAADAQTPDENKDITFTGLDSGYYLITSTNGTLAMTVTTPKNPNATINEKNPDSTIDKQVQEDSTGKYGDKNDADIGQTVNFQVTINVKKGAKNYVMHDEMTEGLTFNANSVKVFNGANEVAGENYTVKTTDRKDSTCTFEIEFKQTYLDTITADTTLTVEYSATLNENAKVGEAETNKAKLTWGDNSHTEWMPTETYTWKIDVYKYTVVKATEEGKENTEKGLANAQFVLYKMVNGVKNYAIVDANNKITGWTTNAYNSAEAVKASVIITPDDGTFTITGLDSDTYYLEEIVAPAGYNVLSGPVKVIINDKGEVIYNETVVDTVKVLNQSGTELPSTGGMGTTIFYVLGGVLMAGAFVLLVVRKRMRTE